MIDHSYFALAYNLGCLLWVAFEASLEHEPLEHYLANPQQVIPDFGGLLRAKTTPKALREQWASIRHHVPDQPAGSDFLGFADLPSPLTPELARAFRLGFASMAEPIKPRVKQPASPVPPVSDSVIAELAAKYPAPDVQIGDTLISEATGEAVTVVGFSNAPISWPMQAGTSGLGGKGGLKMLILTGNLAAAIRVEANSHVAAAWGITRATVSRWRLGLTVARYNAGSMRLRQEAPTRFQEPEVRAKAVQQLKSPEVQARRRATLRARVAFTPEQEALIGTQSDADLAAAWGVPLSRVKERRLALRLPPHTDKRGGRPTLADLKRVVTYLDAADAAKLSELAGDDGIAALVRKIILAHLDDK